jgi:16S rRNA C967 or C1407 C5-methylase (RsmB/RsmF family)
MNPLSDARRGRSKRTRQATKDDAAQDIWFRKSQLGYRCFVEYYATQTDAWKWNDSTDLSAKDLPSSQNFPNSINIPPASMSHKISNVALGLSRAAKRRKKKKGIAVHLNTDDGGVIAPMAADSIQLTKEVTDMKHFLLLAWGAYAEYRPSHHSSRAALAMLFEALSRPLPLTFRIRSTADASSTESFHEEIRSYNKREKTVSVRSMHSSDGAKRMQQQVFVLEYFQANCSKQTLTDVMFKENLLRNSQNGTVARQELGSMLPVAALWALGCFENSAGTATAKARRPLCALDMCASPGSKTLQILEALSEQKRNFRLVANDVLPSRLEALKQAVQRSGIAESLLIHVTYTCQDASKFELCHATPMSQEKPKTDMLQFDLILCDVPCSGDGTCRKDPQILPNWKPNIGNLLHSTQLSILQRALRLLKPNGCVAYSTCTMNPIENEAVVAAALNQFNSQRNTPYSVELMECPTFANVRLRDGISAWKVADYQHQSSAADPCDLDHDEDDSLTQHLRWFDSYEDAVHSSQSQATHHRWASTLWPPSTSSQLFLSKCKRLWPSDQNTGGFFVAIIRKVQQPSDSS